MFVEDSVRAAVEDVSREVALAEAAGAMGATQGLVAAWKRLVAAMALGPPPEYRTCPSCGATGMLMATRCGSCWAPLTPPRREAGASP